MMWKEKQTNSKMQAKKKYICFHDLNSLTVLEGRGEELLTKYLQEELSPLNKKLSKVLPGSCPSYSAPDVRRVWLQYVNPKLHMFEEAEQHVIESIETHAQQHFGRFHQKRDRVR